MASWQALGPSQAIEDALVLSTLLAGVGESNDLEDAFKAYDKMRRQRSQKIAETSRVSRAMLCGESEAEIDPANLKAVFASRSAFIHELDMEKYKTETLEAYREMKGR
jgi:salicylate hydroxylase